MPVCASLSHHAKMFYMWWKTRESENTKAPKKLLLCMQCTSSYTDTCTLRTHHSIATGLQCKTENCINNVYDDDKVCTFLYICVYLCMYLKSVISIPRTSSSTTKKLWILTFKRKNAPVIYYIIANIYFDKL